MPFKSVFAFAVLSASVIAQAEDAAPTVQSVIAKAAARHAKISVDAVCEQGQYRSTVNYGESGFLQNFAQAFASAALQGALLEGGATPRSSPCREESPDGFRRANFEVDSSGLLMRAP